MSKRDVTLELAPLLVTLAGVMLATFGLGLRLGGDWAAVTAPPFDVHELRPAAPSIEPVRIPYPICFGKTIIGSGAVVQDSLFEDSPLLIVGDNTTVTRSVFNGGRFGVWISGDGGVLRDSIINRAKESGIVTVDVWKGNR
ncbi:MAG TPA: hypothetical protein VE958_06990 [Bryobacteraceae bacterium]|nr:hypothetical protein [Bryobacteraceae bacterium]